MSYYVLDKSCQNTLFFTDYDMNTLDKLPYSFFPSALIDFLSKSSGELLVSF